MEAAFNQKLLDFVKDLQALNSGLERPIQQLDMLESGVMLASAVDPEAPMRLFREHVSGPYGHHIEARDDKFFLERSALDADLARADSAGSDNINLVNMVRGVWRTLAPENQRAIWDHMQLLLKLEQKIGDVKAKRG